jgi:hypothetical protein
MKIAIKAKTTWFFGAYLRSLPTAQQPAAKEALSIYKAIAARPEFEKVDMGPDFSRTLLAELTATYGALRGRQIYTEVADFHGWLVAKGMLAANPFLA